MALLGKQTGKKYNFLQVKAMFKMADLDNSGTIDFYEFLVAQRRMAKSMGTEKAAAFMSLAQADAT